MGDLPKDISRFTYYIVLYGARVTAKVIDTQHRRSPLVQGGLEIPIQVMVETDYTEKNRLCLDKYESLVNEKYREPVDGKFEDAMSAILKGLKDDGSKDSNSDLDLDLELEA